MEQRYNLKRGYDFDDGMARYKDEIGLWRVVEISEEGNLAPVDGEVKRDWQGEYLILNSGIHAYINN